MDASMKNPVTSIMARPAATVILMRDRGGIEVLMAHRNDRGMFANAVVFPGGMLEESDRDAAWLADMKPHAHLDEMARALRIAAARELWEETRIVLGETGCRPRAQDIPSSQCAFQLTLRNRGMQLDPEQLIRISHWITPQGPPKRYDTHFFLAALKDAQEAVADGLEIVGLEWARPAELLERDRQEQLDLLLATRANLELLSTYSTPDAAIAGVKSLPIRPITPYVQTVGETSYVTIPEGTPFGNVRVPLHRIQRRRRTRPQPS